MQNILSYLGITVYREISKSIEQQTERQIGILQWMLVGLGVFIVICGIYMTVKRRRKKLAAMQGIIDLYQKVIEDREISPEEGDLLSSILTSQKVENPYLLVSSLKTFDGCVEKEIARIKASGISEEKQQELAMRISRIRRKLGFQAPAFGQPIVSTRELEIGHPMHIILPGPASNKIMLTRVIDIDEMDITITRPAIKEGYLHLHKNQKIMCYIWRDYDAGYYFPTTVLGEVDTPMPLAFLAHSSKLKRMQRRQFFRVPVSLPTTFYHVSHEQLRKIKETKEYLKLQDLEAYDAQIEDLSGGGISFCSNKTINEGELFTIVLDFQDGEKPMQVAGKILHADDVFRDGRRCHLIRAEFAGLSEKKRGRIIRYVYKEQVNESRLSHE